MESLFFLLIISISLNSSSSQVSGIRSYDETVRWCLENDGIIDCSFLAPGNGNTISWDMQRIKTKKGVTPQKPYPFVFKYTADSFDSLTLSGRSYFDLLSLSTGQDSIALEAGVNKKGFHLIGIDLSELGAAELLPDDEDSEQDRMINTQRVVFDFSSNRIQKVAWHDIVAVYFYVVGLADNYSTFFTAARGVALILKNNPLSVTTRLKLYLLRFVLRFRLIFHGSQFFKYKYVDW